MLGDRHGTEGRAGDEGQGAFAADHQLLQDTHWLLFIEEGVERIADGVLGGEFAPDALGQPRIRAHLLTQCRQTRMQIRANAGEMGIVSCREVRAIGQHQFKLIDSTVAVVVDAAAHAAGVVGHDAADLGRLDAGRIGAELATIGGERCVDPGADGTRAAAHPFAGIQHRERAPVATDHREHALRDRLTRE